MPQRHRQNFIGGLIEDNPLASGATTLTPAALAAVDEVVLGTTYIPIVLDPDGIGGAPEIAYITAHATAATTATISRAEESTAAREHKQDIRWVHGPTVLDISPQYEDFTPVISQGGALTTSTLVSRYLQTGNLVFFRGYAVISSSGTSGSAITVTLPVNRAADYTGKEHIGTGTVEDTGTLFINCLMRLNNQTLTFRRTDVAQESIVGANPSFGLVSGDRIAWDVRYEREAI